MQMKTILTEWRKFVNERVKPGEFYPKKFDDFLNLVKEHEDSIWIFFDTETTGLKHKERHVQVTQIGCSAYRMNGVTEGVEPKLIKAFNIKIKLSPETLEKMELEKTVPPEEGDPIEKILNMNRYFDHEGEFSEMQNALEKFSEFLDSIPQPRVIIAQNAPFDVRIINTAYERLGMKISDDELWDTKALLDLHFIPIMKLIQQDEQASEEDKNIIAGINIKNPKGENYYLSTKLGIVTKALGLDEEGWHDALADTQMTAKMFFAVINLVKDRQQKYKVDLSTVKPFGQRR